MSALQLLRDRGDLLGVSAAQPVLLNTRNDIWIVDCGAVDLFFVPLKNGRQCGARQHVCRLTPGAAVLGIDGASLSAGLLAVGAPGTRWLHLSDGWASLQSGTSGRSALTAALDRWVWELAHATAIAGPGPLAEAGAGSNEHYGATTIRAALDRFHTGLLCRLEERHLAALQEEQISMLQKKNREARAFGNALHGMARVLASTGDRITIADTGDHLTDALQAVLSASGFRVRLRDDPHRHTAITGDPEIEGMRHLAALCAQARAAQREVALAGRAWWRNDAGPLLAFRRRGAAPVALLPAPGGYILLDPTAGTRVRIDQESAASLGETAFMFYRTFADRPIGFLELLRFGLPASAADRWRLGWFGLAGGMLGLLAPYCVGQLVDSVIPGADRNQLLQLVLMMLAASIGVVAFELSRSMAILRIETKIGGATDAAIVERLLHLPAPFFRGYAAAELAQRVSGMESILRLLATTSGNAIFGWMFGLFSFAYLFFIDARMALLAGTLVVIALILTTLLNYWRLRLERISQQLQGQNAGRVLQILNGIAKLRAAGAEKRAFTLWAASYSKQKAIAFRIRNLSGALAAFDAGYIVVCFLSLYAAAAFISDDIAPGAFLAFGTAFSQFMGATLAMTTAVTASLNAIALYERVRPILDTLPEVGALQKPPGKLAGSIEINQLSFRYHAAGPLILDDISIKIEPGQFIALVGASGSGKSTLLRLLLGFEKAGSGGIYYDGRSLSSLDAAALRRQFGVVLQSARLMPGNILTNITGATALSLDDAWDAARMAGLEDDIKAMPMGMYTLLAEGAGTFSGGQKQRLMIARAIVRKPAILLFDEATSALDNRTQAIVAKNLESLKATRIVVAHRLSTIINADKIFVIDAGRIVETGNYAELMQWNGRFAGLARRQLA